MKRIDDYILHTPPMRLVEELLESGEEWVTTGVTITPATPFFDAELGGVPAWVGLEYMAQTAAVWVGLDDVRHQRPVELGFLVSARPYVAHLPVFGLDERLRISVCPQFGGQAVLVFDGIIRLDNGHECARAQFTAYRPDDVHAYLRGEIQ